MSQSKRYGSRGVQSRPSIEHAVSDKSNVYEAARLREAGEARVIPFANPEGLSRIGIFHQGL
jgi:hypothetical protein